MTSEMLANSLYIMIAFTWIIYLSQELFISGSSALNWTLANDETDRKTIQEATGLHWDGIEVWFIAAMVVTLGAFPLVFATTFTMLYVVFFLLLYALITRGVVIETLYKLDHPKWVKYNALAWAISSALILFFLGVYITSLFYGLPFENGEMTGGFLRIFSVTTIAGGLLFFALGIVGGGAWIALTTNQSLADKALHLIKTKGVFVVVSVLLLLVYMGINVQDNSLFVGELFSRSPLYFVLPALTVLASIAIIYAGWNKHAKLLYISSIATMALFVLTGFVGNYPIALPSNIDPASSISIFDAITQVAGGRVIFFVVLFAYPVIIGYQSWKYWRFKRTVTVSE